MAAGDALVVSEDDEYIYIYIFGPVPVFKWTST